MSDATPLNEPFYSPAKGDGGLELTEAVEKLKTIRLELD